MNKIHVLIPVYNVEQYLEQAVRSVLDQPYKGIDVVLVDDGSLDNSGTICDRLAAEYDCIEVIHKENGGVSSARNAGIDHILSKYCDGFIAFLDADDLWIHAAIDDNIEDKLSGNDIVGFSTYYANEDVSRFSLCHEYKDSIIEYQNRGSTGWIWGGHFGAHFYSVELLRRFDLRYVVNCRFNEDLIFIMKAIFCSKKVSLFSDYLYVYRANRYSVTHAKKKKMNIASVFEMANSWYEAAFWCDSISNIPEKSKMRWHKFCEGMSGQRLLESFCGGCEYGLPFKEMISAVEASNLYTYLENLDYSAMAKWQWPDLRMFRENKKKLYTKYRLTGIKKRILKSCLNIKPVRKYKEKRQYPIVGIRV